MNLFYTNLIISFGLFSVLLYVIYIVRKDLEERLDSITEILHATNRTVENRQRELDKKCKLFQSNLINLIEILLSQSTLKSIKNINDH